MSNLGRTKIFSAPARFIEESFRPRTNFGAPMCLSRFDIRATLPVKCVCNNRLYGTETQLRRLMSTFKGAQNEQFWRKTIWEVIMDVEFITKHRNKFFRGDRSRKCCSVHSESFNVIYRFVL